MDWFSEHDWETWLALALLLGLAELFSLDLVLLMLAAGALAGMLLGIVDASVLWQVLGAAVAAIAMLRFVRPAWVRRLHSGPDLVQGHDALVGTSALVVAPIDAEAGQIKVSGEIWTARPEFEGDRIPPGARVEVRRIQGATAYVIQISEPPAALD
jgi:membrane protein implicated in regulation of membrane protease activity